MSASLALDIIISVLLILTIAYAMRLNQRLMQLRSDKNELLVLAQTFADATMRAETAIENLKVSSESLTAEVSKAETLKDDLAYLVNRGGKTADEMIGSVKGNSSFEDKLKSSPLKRAGAGGARSARSQSLKDETRLIEDAIRAATPGTAEHDAANPNPDPLASTFEPAPKRILKPKLKPKRKPKQSRVAAKTVEPHNLSSRDIVNGLDGDIEAIGDTVAARELLKALGSVE